MTAAQPSDSPPAEAKKPRMTEDEIAAAVVVGVHRIVKQSTLYTTENQAQRRQLELTQRAVLAYGRRTGRNPKVYFTDNSVFVCGRLLRAGRPVYEAALELGRILGRFGVDEMTVGFDIPVEELRLFQQHVAEAIRHTGPSPAEQRYRRIRMRRGHPPGRRPGKQDDELSPQEQVVRGYATAIVVMRRFLESIQQGTYELPLRVRRVAEQLADLGAVEAPAFLGTTALYNARHEHAGRAVNSALIALGMARQLTGDSRMLSRIAMAALLYDVGLPRVAGMGPTGEGRVGMALPRLGEEQYAELPAATAVSTIALGGFSDAGMTHSVLVYEALCAHHQERIGLPYGGLRPVTIEARIVATARRCSELLADPDEERNADQAISALLREARDDADKTTVRLLMCAIGLFPTGTLVELSGGTIAQVVATSDNPMEFSHPTVRPVVDASGASIGQQGEIDLASPAASGMQIVRVVGMGDDQQVRAASQHRAEARRAQKRTELGLGLVADRSEPAQEVDDRFGSGADVDEIAGPEPDLDFGRQADSSDAAVAPAASVPSSAAPKVPATAPPGAADYLSSPLNKLFDDVVDGDLPPLPELSSNPNPASRAPTSAASGVRQAPAPSPPSGPPTLASAIPAPSPSLASFAVDLDVTHGAADDEDDVPSMVLQAIVDGRSAEADEAKDEDGATAVFTREAASPLAALFFKAAEGEPDSTSAADADDERTAVLTTRGAGSAAVASTTNTTPASLLAAEAKPAAVAVMAMPPKRSSRISRASDAAEGEAAAATTQRMKTAEWLKSKLTGAQPTSQGSLAKTPLVHLLVYMLDRGLTGTTMLVAEGARTHFVYFHDGVPSKVRSSDRVSPLGEVLQELGLATANEVDRALRKTVPGGQLLGRYLVQQGQLDVAGVMTALSWQLVRKMTHMFTFASDTRWAYYEGVNLLDDYGGPELTPAEPLAVIMAGVRTLGQSPLVEQTLARLGTAPLRLRREADVGRFLLSDGERRAVDLLRARPTSLRDLLERRVADERAVKLAIYAMVITRCLNLGTQQRAPVGHDRPPLEAPARRRASMPAFEARGAGPFAEPAHELDSEPLPPPAAADSPSPAPHPQRSEGVSRGDTPSRGTASRGRSPVSRGQPLPRRGTSSALGATMPSRGVARGQGLPRRGTSSADGGAPPRPSAPGDPDARAPAAPVTAEPRARNAPGPEGALSHTDVVAKLGSLDDMNFYELLETDPKATQEQIQSAYFQLAKRWHPDRLPEPLKELRGEVAKIFARINEAQATLNHADKRKDYDALLESGGGTARDREIVERVVDAGLLFQKGEVMFKKGAYAPAETLVLQAVHADPEQPEYRALLAWIQAHRMAPPPQGNVRSDHYDKQIRILDEVVLKDPKFARAFYYRGELLKRSGHLEEAIRDFRTVAHLDPRNIDAAREVRLHDLREQKRKQGGLLGKFFKGKG